jgi:hypothetical protein
MMYRSRWNPDQFISQSASALRFLTAIALVLPTALLVWAPDMPDEAAEEEDT